MTGLLLLLSCYPQRPLTAEGLCADVGYALANRTWDCTGDEAAANAAYEELFEYASCGLEALVVEEDTGWLEDGSTAYFSTRSGEQLEVGEAYACPGAALTVDCGVVETIPAAWGAMVDAAPVCAQVLEIATGGITPAEGCGLEFYAGQTYVLCGGSVTWADAQASCEAMGATLVTIDDAAEEEALLALRQEYSSNPWWLGLTDQGSEGDWRWASGAALEYTNWGTDQPDNVSNEEHCAHTTAGGKLWYDGYCYLSYPYICEG